jgi:hypothetical protein
MLAQRAHAKRRAEERLGVRMNRGEYRRLVAHVQSGKALHWRSVKPHHSYFKVELLGKWCLLLYDRNLHNIVTILTDGPLWDEAFVGKEEANEM